MPSFSEREHGPPAQVIASVPSIAWGGIVALIRRHIAKNTFADDFPETCPDGGAVCGTDEGTLTLAVRAAVPSLPWPLEPATPPPTHVVMDLIEFCHAHASSAELGRLHSYFDHRHLSFNREEGRDTFCDEVNRIFRTNGMAFELDLAGEVQRLAPPVLRDSLAACHFDTGDARLDELLEAARRKFLNPDAAVRRESLEQLWDAWERAKTLLGTAKPAAAKELLDRAADEPTFRDALELEARALTNIGNAFQIRHSETTQVRLTREAHVDYLFHRLFALLWLVVGPSRGSNAPRPQ